MARNLIASERLRHAAIAVGIAVLVAITTILRPLDITVWSLQAKLFDHQPSGEIVFVEVEHGPDATGEAAKNRRLLRSLRLLNDAGVERVFIDMPIYRSSVEALDASLRNELTAMGDDAFLTKSVRRDFDEGRLVRGNDPFFERGMLVVSSDYKTDFLGFVWGLEPEYSEGSETLPALWRVLSAAHRHDDALFPDYTIDLEEVPQYDLDKIGDELGSSANLSGKSVVLGPAGSEARIVKIPGQGFGPSSLIHVMAAETVLRGSGRNLNWYWVVGAFGLTLMVGIAASSRPRTRRLIYLLWGATLVAFFLATAQLGIRTAFASVLAFAAVYAAQRATVNFKRRHLYIEPRSKLPNFVALQRDFGDRPAEKSSVVVAKIARLDAVFATLSPADQGKYLRQLASRLALGDARSTIYYDGGKYFAFVVSSADYQDLAEHLEGLRAVASQSITVSGRVLDVSMTIGVDESPGKSISSRLSAAIAAADQAREAYRPVFIISDFAADSEEWDYSLQARLESALSEDRISIKLQPQVAMNDGTIVGVEALARWVDVERGEIPPSRFILQCERVGRLDELTKRILGKSLDAMADMARAGQNPRMSVNVSAIQFVDSRIAELIEKSLATHSADARQLTIEVTETARIEDFSAARDVFEQIGRLGVRLSIDDFGVASANLEALYELPFDELKIDQMFVQNMHRSQTARAIVSNVIRLAREAKLVSVAEGIEDKETFELLRNLGCDIGQGYHIARPMVLSGLQEILDLQRDHPMLRHQT
ncbi:EAL domain-containing protein [Pelagerythrobacter marensis]|uniref:EAL domain-containing protein n=1 Tax=Pelagerythrobacter marensis TaxID=543877 RepID=UPI00064B46BB|nr:EAL domain-containing protein [Pelagerythrobacter marensis]